LGIAAIEYNRDEEAQAHATSIILLQMKDRQRRGNRSRFNSKHAGLHAEGLRARDDQETAKRSELVFGAQPIRELIAAAPEAVTTLYLADEARERFERESEILRESGGQVLRADPETLARLAGRESRHQGVVAIIREYRYAEADSLVEENPDPLLLIDGVMDPRNLGAILRGAECAGAKSVLLARDRTVGITPAAIKASAGAWVHLRIARCGNVAATIEHLKERGYWIAAMVPGGETSLYDLDISRRLALVIGSEDRGVRQLVRKSVDFRVGIPMRGRVSSLNVSVATAVALFEIDRARRAQS
jgi:23S rRNA (guanosine2251-2'-O)-methyltransferase